MGNARSGQRRYAYPVTVGDAIRYLVPDERLYQRMRDAFYKRAGLYGHRVSVRRSNSILVIHRVA